MIHGTINKKKNVSIIAHLKVRVLSDPVNSGATRSSSKK